MREATMDDRWMTTGEGHPRRWRILAVLVVSLLMTVLDNSVLNIALPTMQRDLHASQSDLVWAVDSYVLAFAALLFTWGVLGDRIGRKKVLLTGMLVFGAASATAAFSSSTGMLISMRTIMGIVGAAVLPTTLAIITVVFPPHERGRAIGMWAGSVGGAIALGPVLGGLLLEHPEWTHWLTGNDWGSVFLINVPIVIIGATGIWREVPETRNPHPGRLDITGLVVSVVGLVSLVYGIIHASQTQSWTDRMVVIPIIVGVLILAGFVITEARSDLASFDVSLFRNRGYSVSLTAVSLAFFAMSGVTFTLPFYFQVVRGYSTLAAGFAFLPFAVGQLLAAPRSARMVGRFGFRPVMTVGLLIVSTALLLLTRLSIDTPIWQLLLIFFIYGLGMGNVMAPGTSLMQNVLPLARAGAGSAVQNTVRQVAGALGIAIIGTVLSTQYSNAVAPVLDRLSMLPGSVRGLASQSIVTTQAVITQAQAQGLPASAATSATAGAFDAFITATHVTLTISFVALFLGAILIATLLPKIQAPTQGGAGHGGPRPAAPSPANADDTNTLMQREADAYAAELAEEVDGRES